MIWDILNLASSVVIAACAAYKLIDHFDAFKTIERGGLGIMAGSALLTIPPLLTTGPTPFDDWSPFALRVGISLYLIGKVRRLLVHRRNNEAFLRVAESWRKDRR